MNAIFEYWLQAPWPAALLMATAVHLTIYLTGGAIGIFLTFKLWPMLNFGRLIDQQPLKALQMRTELRNGVIACLIFGVITLTYRRLCEGYWPATWREGALQIGAFLIFNNLYAYGTHRLLHSRSFMRFHRVHHWSVRVTPWSGYSVHPVEAVIIGMTLPLFMLILPLGVGTAFVLHALGMWFTTCIHCNYELMPAYPDSHWFKRLINDPAYHRFHHSLGNVNYGFTSRFMDRAFGTIKE